MYITKSITRIALLIGSSGIENDRAYYLPGVNKDIKNFYNFLMSPVGGSWKEEEIKIFLNPKKDDLLNFISSIKSDYSFTVFSGHGYITDKSKNTNLILKKNRFSYNEITERDLMNYSKRQTIIVDACRGIEKRTGLGDSITESYKTINLKKSTRKIFDFHVMECEEGEVFIYATSKNQFAGEDEDGSYFAQSLLKISYDRGNSIGFKTMNFNQYKKWQANPKILDIQKAFISTCQELAKFTTVQTPTLNGQRRFKWFPFAIRCRNIEFY